MREQRGIINGISFQRKFNRIQRSFGGNIICALEEFKRLKLNVENISLVTTARALLWFNTYDIQWRSRVQKEWAASRRNNREIAFLRPGLFARVFCQRAKSISCFSTRTAATDTKERQTERERKRRSRGERGGQEDDKNTLWFRSSSGPGAIFSSYVHWEKP